MPVGFKTSDNTPLTLNNLSFSRIDRNMSLSKQTTDVNLNDFKLRRFLDPSIPNNAEVFVSGTTISMNQFENKTMFRQFYSGQYFENDSGSGTDNSGQAGINLSDYVPDRQVYDGFQFIVACSNFDDSINSSWCPTYQRVHRFFIAYGFDLNTGYYFDSDLTFIGSISGTILTVESVSKGQVVPGIYLNKGVSGTQIVEQLSGSELGSGTYRVNISQTLSSQSIDDDTGQPGSRWTMGSGGLVKDARNPANTLNFPWFNARAASQSSGKFNNIAISYDGGDYVQFDSYNSGNSTSSPRGVIDLLRMEYIPSTGDFGWAYSGTSGFHDWGYYPLSEYTSTTYRAAFPISNV
jgi:hypothetical protein